MSSQQAGVFILIIGLGFIAVAAFVMLWDRTRGKKYTEQVYGTIIGHKWIRANDMRVPCAVVQYAVDGKEYRCIQRYRLVMFNSVKHAEADWILDEKYRLHCYVTRKCQRHVNPAEELFPINSQMPVYYIKGNPHKSYCGSLRGMGLLWIILGSMGMILVFFGVLLVSLA